MRKLASIQRVSDIIAIDGADQIECVSILGWSVVVAKKDNFKVGDLVCYVEIDSILPERPEFEFLRERKFRVRTIKLRQQVSQGICFPLSVLPKGKYSEGDDVTEILGVVKYDPQAAVENRLMNERMTINKNRMDKFLKRYKWYRSFIKPNRLPFPSFIKKTDEDRIQLFPGICEKHKDTVFNTTEKVDGQSVTYFIMRNPSKWGRIFNRYLFGVCSRNFQLYKIDNSSYWDVAKRLQIKNKMVSLISQSEHDHIVLQGEIIGPKIQGNKYQRFQNGFYAFNIFFDEEQGDNQLLNEIMCMMELYTVPLLQDMKLAPTIKENLELANGTSFLSDTRREGVVLRNYKLGLSFKIVSPEFLLKHGE
jgi:hypothetical protein